MGQRLPPLTAAFRSWAATADKSEDGWQSSFPDYGQWTALASEAVLNTAAQSSPFQSDVLAAWEASEERGEIVDAIRDDPESPNWPGWALAASEHESPDLRMQAFMLTALAPREVQNALLQRGLRDVHPYCRRVTMLSILEHAPDRIDALRPFIRDETDPHNRWALVQACTELANPPAPHTARKYTCPVCGYARLDHHPPSATGEVCPCCATVFGVPDHSASYRELQDMWIARGMAWADVTQGPPDGWDPVQQLRTAGFPA